MSQTPQRVLDIILETKEKRSKSLSLKGERLGEIPPEVFELEWLEALDLTGSNIDFIPKDICRLSNLKSIYLGSYFDNVGFFRFCENFKTRIMLPGDELLEYSSEHRRIYYYINSIKSLPNVIKNLKFLKILDLTNNGLKIIPDVIYELRSLEILKLGNEGEVFRLSNQIKVLSPKILQLTNLRELTLEGNPIETPPPEVVAKGLEAIKDYFRQLEAEGEDYIYEAKLLIVGEAGAGKTTLAKKIENSEYELDSDEKSTEGIDVIQWHFPIGDGRQFRVNIWDFGGQEIYHATHQFFLTKRSLYALVCDTRKEDTDFYYWLNVVELLSDKSPLIIVKNEKQERKREIPERQLRGQFTNFEKTLATNLATNRGLPTLLTQLKHYLSNLPHIREKLPKTWVKVREALEAEPRGHIRLDEYLAICTENGFTKRKDALQLSGYLHDLGVILHFQDDQSSLLYRKVILNPEWGTTAVYRVLDNQKVIANLGQFTQDDLSEIWHEPDYGHMLGELLELMLKFELCYHIPAQKRYIAPQLLSANQPTYDWDEQNNLILRYTATEFMPKGIITRFIVAMHHLIEQQKYVWREGVILQKNDTRAEVIEYYGKRELRIRFSGQYKKELMILVTNELNKLFDSFHRLKYSKLIPCNCLRCKGSQTPHFYEYETLRKFAAYGRYEDKCDKPPFHTVNVLALIDDVSHKKEASHHGHPPKQSQPTNKQIRQRLKIYDDVDFDALCLDDFEEVYDKFAKGMQRDAKINLLLDYSRRQPDGLRKLWELITLNQIHFSERNR